MHPPHRLPYIDHLLDQYPQGAKIHNGDVAKAMIEHPEKPGKIWVITITRNRFYRDISAYFQNVLNFNSPFTAEQVLSVPISQLHEDFRRRFPVHEDSWFQTVFMKAVGVNLTDVNGYDHGPLHVEYALHGRSIQILLLRFEDISDWQGTLGTHFPGFEMAVKENNGNQKWYAARYEEFLNTYEFSPSEITLLCGSDTWSFYSVEEKMAMAPQCYASPFISPNLIKDAGRMYTLAGNSRLLLEDLDADASTELSNP